MKILVTLLIFLSSINLSFSQEEKKIDIKKSKIEWIGKKIGGEHSGVIQIKSGSLVMTGNKIISGEFIIDMNTIECTDLSGRAKQSIESHLKDEDFFHVDKYPTSSLKINKSDDKKIYGTITIKNQSEPIEFEYKLVSRGGQKIVNSEIIIDRTKFDISYKSKTIFPELIDNIIYDDFTIKTSPIIFY